MPATSAGVPKRRSGIFSTMPETGGNTLDVLLKYGPEDTTTWLRIQHDDLKTPIDPMEQAAP